MKRHALWFSFAEGVDASEREAVLGAFVRLGDHLGHVDSFACGPGVDPDAREAGLTYAFAVLFETEAAREAYRALPEYAAALARLAGLVEGGADGISVATTPDE